VAHGVPPGTLYIPGPGGDAENKALSIDGKRAFRLNAGDVQAAGDGSQFLPFKQGTIEFFMRPAWDVSELPDGTPRFVRMATNKDDWSLWYLRDSKTAYPWFSNSLHGWFMTDGASDVSSIRTYRRTVFMPGEWVHLAWTWGTISRMDYHGRTTSNLVTRVYVNGRAGQQYSWTLKGNQPRDPPSALMLMNILPGKSTAYDELRISDTIRYTGDFTPPVLGTEFRVDAHTRALFHFNGNIEGKSAGAKSPLPATLVP